MITKTQLRIKRLFDFSLVIVFLPFLIIPIFLLIVIATIDTRKYGVFTQYRIGQHGKPFKIYKIRTLRDGNHQLGNMDKYASKTGVFLRKSKLNELPQLFNVLIGDMSFVGPRPDLEGFADKLEGEDRIILLVKPGITGPATLKYKNEENILARHKDPEHYNRTIIWVDKVKINKNYVKNYSFYLDLRFIFKSILNK
ncbi:sugar transferase [Winogradskyella endarachnes]|uniref:Sugar transferase n=1 Tax=Winogradskyella endarachnes TaxID=2681965 RepID=A0A6L6U668_9FLAO|nr:sugar transferase [Winogradskyella endarachnes]MUU77658.1 sugar transferase [Winogradskyella endarachnes]